MNDQKISSGSLPDIIIDPGILEKHVQTLVSTDKPRSFLHKKSLDQAGEYIEDTLKQYGIEPRRQEFKAHGSTVWNVLANLGDPAAPMIVIGAHYDVCGDTPGADDNGSAVAGLLEIAKVFKQRSH